MSFLTPLFFLGLLGLIVPLLIHLQRRHRSQVQPFPSLMFLERMEIPTRRHRRIRNWLLLALRSLVIAVLVTALARPWWRTGAAAVVGGEEGKAIVVLLDHSFSMGFEDRWERAMAAVRDVVSDVEQADRVSIVTFASSATELGEATSDPLVLQAWIEEIELSSRGTQFEPALRIARRLLMESDLERREVVLVSDFQRSGWGGEQSVELPQGTELRIVDLSGRDRHGASPANAVVSTLLFEHEESDDRERVRLQARVANLGSADLQGIEVVLELNGRTFSEQRVDLEGGASKIVSFDSFSLPEGVSRGEVRLSGDSLEKDNRFFFVLSRSQAVPVVVVERGRAGNSPPSGFYVERALNLARRPRFRVRSTSDRRFGSPDIDQASLVVMSDVPLPTGETADRLVRFVEEGGGLLIGLGSRSNASSHAALSERGLVPPLAGEAVAAGSRPSAGRISYFDRSYPGFESFSAPRSGDFGAARFFRFHRILPEVDVDHVLARFDGGEPALVERRLGRGRVLIWASTLDRYWNDFPLKPVFVPLIHQAGRRLSDFTPLPAWNGVGEILDLQVVLGAPAGEALAIERIVAADGKSLETEGLLTLDREGFYEIQIDGEDTRVLAANLEAIESDLTTLDPVELAAKISPREVETFSSGVSQTASAEQREGAQGLWRYFVVALVLLLIGETFLSNRTRGRMA